MQGLAETTSTVTTAMVLHGVAVMTSTPTWQPAPTVTLVIVMLVVRVVEVAQLVATTSVVPTDLD